MDGSIVEIAPAVLRQLLLFTAILTPLELLLPAVQRQGPIRRGLATDLLHFALSPFLISIGISLTLALLSATLAALLPAGLRQALSAQAFWVQLVEVLVTSELLAYWAHRASHRIPLLWRFHAVHHSTTELDWLAAHRAHPLESVWLLALANLPALTLGFSTEPIVGVVLFQKLYTAFLHGNLRLDLRHATWLVATPRFHRWHHDGEDRRGRNFAGLLPVFDRLFGTYALPDGEPPRLGTDEPVPRGYIGQLLYPVWPAGGSSVEIASSSSFLGSAPTGSLACKSSPTATMPATMPSPRAP